MTTSVPTVAHPEKFKHPRGLMTLFFTEMWERASYYGMRALLVLFLAAPMSAGGMGLDEKTATAIYGIYTACVYVFALPGGWIADRLLGMQNAVFYGGIIIALGHFSMALPWDESFYFGLVLIVLGTGLLKPTISSLVGELYQGKELIDKRDAGFSIYYMGINLGAIMGPLICGYLGENVNWHYGFAASGIGMVLGLIQFRMTRRHLHGAGEFDAPKDEKTQHFNRKAWLAVGLSTGTLLAFIGSAIMGWLSVDPINIAAKGSYIIVTLFACYMVYMYRFCNLTPIEQKRLIAAGVLFVFNALFWAGFEQAGSSFNLFAEKYTDRMIGGWEMPASWFQSVNAICVVTLAPFFAAMWVKLAQRNLNPSSPVKFALGLAQLGLGFGVMAAAAGFVMEGEQVLPTWLLLTYLLHTMGELCLSPIGLSMTTKLAPKGYASQMLGLFFMSSALGNLVAGLLAGHLSHGGVESDMSGMFMQVMIFCLVSAALLMVLKNPIRKLMSGVH